MWIEPILALALIAKGLIVGIVASAPMGPVGILTIQRTLNKGRWYGFVTGCGAAISDMFYAIISGLGLSFVLDFVERGPNRVLLSISGSILLFIFGIWMFFSKPAQPHRPSRRKGTLAHNALTGFLVTLSNPLIVFLFLALFTRFAFVVPDHPVEQVFGYLGIFGGALLWWFCLSGVINRLRNRFHMETIRRINRCLGIIVMLVSLVGLVLWLFDWHLRHFQVLLQM